MPTRFHAQLLLAPDMQVTMLVRVDGGGRAKIREITVASASVEGSITTSALRGLPLDSLLRAALDQATVKVKPRPDIDERAFQVPGDPDNQAWVSPTPAPTGRGKKVPQDRVARAAQVYLQALAAGSSAPGEVVAKVLGYSRATAARDIRAARNRKPPLLPPVGEHWEVPADASPPSRTGSTIPDTGTGRVSWMPHEEFVRRAEELGLRGPGPTGKRAADLTPVEREEMAARIRRAGTLPGAPLDEHPE
ncbi:MAG: hypothetical protein ACRDNS_14565 [Trebonia sp.]